MLNDVLSPNSRFLYRKFANGLGKGDGLWGWNGFGEMGLGRETGLGREMGIGEGNGFGKEDGFGEGYVFGQGDGFGVDGGG